MMTLTAVAPVDAQDRRRGGGWSRVGSVLVVGWALVSGSGCAGTRDEFGGTDPAVARGMMEERAAAIAAEPLGDHYIGRRYVVDQTRLWGYLRRPGQPWSSARLVVMNEDRVRQPDRLPEDGAADATGRGYGFDHNHEYRVRGRFTGRTVYDPNSNLELPEFQPTAFELLDASPGFLFKPGESLGRTSLPAPVVRP